MKKKLAFILALAAMASTSATAFADTNTGNAPTSIDVNGKYVAGDARSVISVDVTWEDMTFVYMDGDKEWNPKTHEYETKTSGCWDDWTKEVTVTNHSNVEVRGSVNMNSNDNNVSYYIDNGKYVLASAEGTSYENAPKNVSVLLLVNGKISKDEKLGTLTVSISENLPVTVSTWQELVDAVEAGGKITLSNDITAEESISNGFLDIKSDTELDLNGHTLNVKYIYTSMTGVKNYKIKNGTINLSQSYISNRGTMTIEGCNISVDGTYPVSNLSTMTIKDCTFSGSMSGYYAGNISNEGKLTVSGTVIAPEGILAESSKDVTILAGTYNFDPTEYVDTDVFTVTKSGENWVVAKK